MRLVRVLPVAAAVVITLLASTVVGTLSRFTSSISNPANQVQTGTVGLTENGVCPTPADGDWHDCGVINKFGGGTLSPAGPSTTSATVTNTGTVPARLYLLPSQCSDSVAGAHGPLCGQVSIQVSCGGTVVVPARTLNAFHDGRNFPSGYLVATLAPQAATTCNFTLTAASVTAAGSVSQPMAWKLTAGS